MILKRNSPGIVFAVALPSVLGLVVALSLQKLTLSNPLMVWRITVDAGTLILIVGLGLSSLGSLGATVAWYWSARAAKTLTAERERQVQAQRQFIQRLDHEMKNPLGTLQVSLANLENSIDTEKQLRIAQEQSVRLNRLLRSLRKIVALPGMPLELTRIDIANLITQAITDTRKETGTEQRAVQLSVQQVPWRPHSILADHDLLYLAFCNLIENALKFTNSNSLIEIRITERKGNLIVEVADNGSGIPGTDLPHIFEPLFRGSNSRGVPGSGLGLPLVKGIVERHRGRIDVQSHLGQGTIFTIYLPIK